MCVLHLISSAGRGGRESQILELARGQVQAGQHVGLVILYRSVDGDAIHPLVSMASGWGIAVTQLEDRVRFPVWLVPRVANAVRQGGFRLLHAHGYKADLLGFVAARLAGVPIVATTHGYTDAFPTVRLYRHLDLRALRWFPRVIAVSEYLRRELITAGLSPERVVTVHNAIDLETFRASVCASREQVRAELGIEPDAPVVLTVGRLNPEKGHRYLLESAQIVCRQIPNLRVLIVGEGPLRPELEEMIRALDLGTVVTLLGWQDNVASLMVTSDLLVLPSIRESFGLVILEALAVGVPVVSTRVGGVPEVIQAGETGFLVEPRDPEALAGAVIWALTNPAAAAQLARKGQDVVRRRFCAEGMVRATDRVYRAVLSL